MKTELCDDFIKGKCEKDERECTKYHRHSLIDNIELKLKQDYYKMLRGDYFEKVVMFDQTTFMVQTFNKPSKMLVLVEPYSD